VDRAAATAWSTLVTASMMPVVNVAMYSMALTCSVLLQVGHMVASRTGHKLKTRVCASRRIHNCLLGVFVG